MAYPRSFKTFSCRVLALSTVSLCLLFSQTVLAEGLMEIYQKAQNHDPSFKIANFQKMATADKRRQAVAGLLPSLSASAEYKLTSQDIISSDNDVFGSGADDYDTTTYGLTLTQPLFRWDSIVGLKQSKAEMMRAEAEYALSAQELILRVATLYLQVLATQDQLEFALAEQAAVEKLYEQAITRHEMGLIPKTDLHDAKARMTGTLAKTIQAQDLVDDALQALQEVCGGTVGELNTLQGEIPMVSPDPADIDSWVQAALDENPAIALREFATEIARQEVRRQESGHYPTLDLVGRYHIEETKGSLFGGGSEVESTDLLLQLSVPLYQGGMVSSRVSEADYRLNIAQQELLAQTNSIKRQTRSAYLGVNNALKRVEALQQSLLASKMAQEAKQDGYRSGLYSSLAVLDAERDLFLAQQDYAQARYDYLLNTLLLKQTTGRLTDQDLKQLDQWFK